jgi:hypothetical protein
MVSAGLCDLCAWTRLVKTATATYRLCTRGLTDPAFAKYPVLPVATCRGYEPARPAPGEGMEGR